MLKEAAKRRKNTIDEQMQIGNESLVRTTNIAQIIHLQKNILRAEDEGLVTMNDICPGN